MQKLKLKGESFTFLNSQLKFYKSILRVKWTLKREALNTGTFFLSQAQIILAPSTTLKFIAV